MNRNLSNCEKANGIRTRGLCISAAVLYQTELWRLIHRRPANLLSLSTRERNETQNEMMWTAGIQMKWGCDHRKGFRGFNGIRTRGLCVSATVLFQPELWRPIHWRPANLLEFINPWKEWNTEWNDEKNGVVNTMEPKRTKGTKQRKSSQVLTLR